MAEDIIADKIEAAISKIPEFIKAIGIVVWTYVVVYIVAFLALWVLEILMRLTARTEESTLKSLGHNAAGLVCLFAAGYALKNIRHYKLFSRVCGGVLIGWLTHEWMPTNMGPLWGCVLLGAGIAALSGLSESKPKQAEAIPAPVPTKSADPTHGT